MITKKLLLQSIIKKYHLDINEAVEYDKYKVFACGRL